MYTEYEQRILRKKVEKTGKVLFDRSFSSFFLKIYRNYSKILRMIRSSNTARKTKFSIKDFFSNFLRIWSHLLKKSLMENFIFRAVKDQMANFGFFLVYTFGNFLAHVLVAAHTVNDLDHGNKNENY